MSKELEALEHWFSFSKNEIETFSLIVEEKYRDNFKKNSFSLIKKDKDIIETAIKSYKDIEEELGIDLITLLKVWNAVLQKKYLWTKYDNKLDETNDIEIGDEYNGLLYIYFYWDDGKHLTFYLKDYGKTWALTKEELE